MKTIGIDIGTTTISLVCRTGMDAESETAGTSGEICAVRTIENDSSLQANAEAPADRDLQCFAEAQRIQDPQRIADIVLTALDEMLSEHPDVRCIGLTGQMHGIVCTDSEGKAVSPLYTWQDRQGNVPLPDGKTIVQRIRETAELQTASGYGLVTYLCLQSTHRLPARSVSICTIPDYIGMLLTGRKSPLIHTSMAASLGFYDVRNNCYDRAALEAVGINPAILPQVTKQIEISGTFRGIPVTTAIGDNQASFLGSVGLREGVPLINIGTGGQISVMSDRYVETAGIETRPLIDDSFLCVGASLCGGRAYAILEKFFREYAAAADCAAGSQYEIMRRLAEEAYETSLIVNTQFQGTRGNPEERGSILNISEENFTPGGLIVGVLQGISRELCDLYSAILAQTGDQCTTIVGSGNGLRRNPLLQRIIEEMFHAQLVIPDPEEEAACGAAWAAQRCV